LTSAHLVAANLPATSSAPTVAPTSMPTAGTGANAQDFPVYGIVLIVFLGLLLLGVGTCAVIQIVTITCPNGWNVKSSHKEDDNLVVVTMAKGPDEDIVLDSNTDGVEDELESHSVKGKTSQQASPQPWQSRVVLPPSHGEGVGNQDETATRDSIDIIAIQGGEYHISGHLSRAPSFSDMCMSGGSDAAQVSVHDETVDVIVAESADYHTVEQPTNIGDMCMSGHASTTSWTEGEIHLGDGQPSFTDMCMSGNGGFADIETLGETISPKELRIPAEDVGIWHCRC